jgi:hypothetical protein
MVATKPSPTDKLSPDSKGILVFLRISQLQCTSKWFLEKRSTTMSSRLLLNKGAHRYLSKTPSRAAHNKPAVVGIVRETYGNWERRVPLVPDHVKELTQGGFKVIVQPSTRRIFPDTDYKAAGAEINEDLSGATVILGVKQVPVANLIEDKSYIFFSHTIKAQQENMDLLDNIISKNITLFDYECIINPKDGKRMVAFGQFAGIVGMVIAVMCLFPFRHSFQPNNVLLNRLICSKGLVKDYLQMVSPPLSCCRLRAI